MFVPSWSVGGSDRVWLVENMLDDAVGYRNLHLHVRGVQVAAPIDSKKGLWKSMVNILGKT